jgi:hypothetical protein
MDPAGLYSNDDLAFSDMPGAFNYDRQVCFL